MSAADGLARLSRRLHAAGVSAASSSLVWRLSLAMAVVSAVVPGRQPLWRVFAPSHYRAAPAQAAGLAALMLIPPDTSVVAQAAIAPHLSERVHIFVLDEQAPDADYVITAASLSPWPISTFEELRKIVDERFGPGYDVIFDRSGWRVLRRARRT